jgi:translation initiation factor 3 subunit H
MKIIKHSRESHTVVPAPANTSNATVTFNPAVGQLFGIDSNGTLEVSNAFGLPAGTLGGSLGETDGESKGAKAGAFSPFFSLPAPVPSFSRSLLHTGAKYTAQLVNRLSDVNADASVVGFYTSSNNGQVLATGGFLEALVGAQLSGGGIGSGHKATSVSRPGLGAKQTTQLASGAANKSGSGIALVYGALIALFPTRPVPRIDDSKRNRHLERRSGCRWPQGLPPLRFLRRGLPRWQVRHC